MAVNKPKGDNARVGAVRKRTQYYNPRTGRWVKAEDDDGTFVDVKSDGKPFKGVRKG